MDAEPTPLPLAVRVMVKVTSLPSMTAALLVAAFELTL